MRDLGGSCDFAKDIAQPYTLRVIMDIYGVPEEDEPLMLDLTQGIFGAADPEFLGDADDPGQRMMASVMQFIQYFNELTDRPAGVPGRRPGHASSPTARSTACPMGDVERLWYYIIVATAGHDTTSFALSGGMEQLARAPDAAVRAGRRRRRARGQRRRGGHPLDVAGAPLHALRHRGPTAVAGVDIPEGGRVLLCYPSANRDEGVFTDPTTFDVRRPDADRPVGFGGGAHFCLGAQFARRELRTMLGRLCQELDHVELAGEVSYAQSTSSAA